LSKPSKGCSKRVWKKSFTIDPSLTKELVECCSCRIDFRAILRLPSVSSGSVVIAKVGAILFIYRIGSGLATLIRDTRIKIDAHAAHVQLGATLWTGIAPSKGERQRGQGVAALPTNQIM
jgi:hypothetical protein